MAPDARLQDLSNRMREAALGPHLEGPHTEQGILFYHYTTAEGLRGILETGDLWATNAFYLNDQLETEYGQRFCDEFLLTQLRQRPDSHFVTFLSGCRGTISGHEAELFPHELQFITSFSLNGDLLSQWRAYADGGKGFSLGFSPLDLLHLLGEIAGQTDEKRVPHPLPMKVLYNRDEQERNLSEVLTVVEKEWPSLEADFLHDDDTNKALKAMGALWLATACMYFKDEAFAQEEEVRVLYSNVREMKVANTRLAVCLRSRNGLLIPYRPLGLAGNGMLLPISKIIMGPLLDGKRTKLALEMYLQSSGYTGKDMPEITEARLRLQS